MKSGAGIEILLCLNLESLDVCFDHRGEVVTEAIAKDHV